MHLPYYTVPHADAGWVTAESLMVPMAVTIERPLTPMASTHMVDATRHSPCARDPIDSHFLLTTPLHSASHIPRYPPTSHRLRGAFSLPQATVTYRYLRLTSLGNTSYGNPTADLKMHMPPSVRDSSSRKHEWQTSIIPTVDLYQQDHLLMASRSLGTTQPGTEYPLCSAR